MVVSIPQWIQERLVAFTRKRWEGRRELRRGEPNFCRLMQLALMGWLMKSAARIETTAGHHLPGGRGTWGQGLFTLLIGTFVALCVALYAIGFPDHGFGSGFPVIAFIPGLLVGAILVLVGGSSILWAFGWGLSRAARFCPIRVNGLSRTIETTRSAAR